MVTAMSKQMVKFAYTGGASPTAINWLGKGGERHRVAPFAAQPDRVMFGMQDHRHPAGLVRSISRFGSVARMAKQGQSCPAQDPGDREDRLRRHRKPVLALCARRSRPFGKGGRGDEEAQFSMAGVPIQVRGL